MRLDTISTGATGATAGADSRARAAAPRRLLCTAARRAERTKPFRRGISESGTNLRKRVAHLEIGVARTDHDVGDDG